MEKELNEDAITKKDIFMSGFKSKIGYSFTYKDLNEFETIIDFYEQQCKKQKEVIDKVVECLNLWQIPECDKGTMREILFNTNKQNVLDILNEVSE